jgi:hypothetical protein
MQRRIERTIIFTCTSWQLTNLKQWLRRYSADDPIGASLYHSTGTLWDWYVLCIKALCHWYLFCIVTETIFRCTHHPLHAPFPNATITVMIGIFLGVIGEILLEKAEARKDQQSEQLMSEVLKTCKNSRVDGGNDTDNQAATREVLELDNSSNNRQGPAGVSPGGKPKSSSTESLAQVILNIVKLELPVVGALLLVALWVGWMEGWSIIGSVYWLVVTGTTVGFGDYHPTLPTTRLFCIFFLPIAVAVLGKLLARIASAYMDGKVKRQEKEFLSRSLALCDLQVMDTDANGHVDLAEFLSYMLVALQKVNKDDIREIREVFDRLDVDKSGVLTIHDLKTQAWDLTMKDSMKNLYGGGTDIGTGSGSL